MIILIATFFFSTENSKFQQKRFTVRSPLKCLPSKRIILHVRTQHVLSRGVLETKLEIVR